MWKIQLPLRIPVSKNREFPLNLNQYRNAHYQTLDKAKKNFTELAEQLILAQQIPKLDKCLLEYTLYPGTRQLCDVNNVCTVVDKFFSDSLVAAGILADDNYNFIADSRFRFGHVDRENPRVEVIITSPDHLPMVPPERIEDPMKIQTQTTTTITLSPDDLKTAVLSYLKSQGIEAELRDMSYAAQPGGDLTLTMVSSAAVTPTPAATPVPGKPGRKPKLEPKQAMQAVEETLAAKHAAESSELPESPAEASEGIPEEPAGEEFDHSPKTPEELAQDELRLKSLVEKPAEKPAEKVPAPEKIPEKPKGPSLFAGFKRPSNT